MTYSLGLAKIKQEFFFVSSLVQLFAYAYDPYVTGLISFLCFALIFILMFKCEPDFNVHVFAFSPRSQYLTYTYK